MKTTFNIDDSVMQALREEAARRRTTMSSLVEAGLRRFLQDCKDLEAKRDMLPPLPKLHMGKPLVDYADREALYRFFDEEEG